MLENLKKYKIVLASNSPRRRNLLSGLDIDFEVRIIPDIDESYPDSIDSMEIPLYILPVRKRRPINRLWRMMNC